MVDYMKKGQVYDLWGDTEAREEIETLGVVARCQTWPEVPRAIQAYLRAQDEGTYKDGALYKLRVWKNPHLTDFPWCLKWIPKEDMNSDDTTVVLGLDRP
jgi:hypothetical protein